MRKEVQKLRTRYPDPLSAVMPALRLAQEENGGWLSPDAIREVAAAMPRFLAWKAGVYRDLARGGAPTTWERTPRTAGGTST